MTDYQINMNSGEILKILNEYFKNSGTNDDIKVEIKTKYNGYGFCEEKTYVLEFSHQRIVKIGNNDIVATVKISSDEVKRILEELLSNQEFEITAIEFNVNYIDLYESTPVFSGVTIYAKDKNKMFIKRKKN